MTRVYESPRVTKPYTEEQWTEIEKLGHAIDADLKKDDVRLTMGGEPTFVSVDDPDGAEWNFTAVSHKKRVLSGELIKRLREKFAPGSLLHYGQGKWYPGEPLPRWALGRVLAQGRRADLEGRFAHRRRIEELRPRREGGEGTARRASPRLVGADPKHLMPAYEDAFYYTWKERRLPSNVTPEKSNLKDKQERERIARIFQQGLGAVVGYALPIKRAWHGNEPGWMSGAWFLRDDDTLWLIPGDSPMGLRLPLDSIPWVAEKDYPWLRAAGSVATQTAASCRRNFRIAPALRRSRGSAATLPGQGRGQRAQKLGEKPKPLAELPPEENPTAPARPGRERAVDHPHRALRRAARRTAARLHAAGRDDGRLSRPHRRHRNRRHRNWACRSSSKARRRRKDPRLNKLAVTPDPGVIEVNMHPSKTWDELVERTTMLYEEARQTRLGTEKFMLDGRHTGTGGGNHIIIGGETPPDSPVLRRPDLLRSLLAYWQNHPSLSWLFSGLFIGPTSQAPRIDEARNDSLYELEVAFKEMDRQIGTFGQTPPWLVDRLFRNLLIDASGNTHRAEFCIDKLYAPESSSGRLGLVEMRAFEMPPHARMSLAQHLLLRGLVAKFWKEPYKNGLVRWGTDIHDRWMLPHFCETDFKDVIGDLRDAGYPFEFDWFAPHFEFRFPRIGDLEQRDVADRTPHRARTVARPRRRTRRRRHGALRGQLARTPAGQGARPRRATASPSPATAIACRCIRPARTAKAWPACAIAPGSRRSACNRPSASHAPLRFDLYDTWNQRSLGGCTYHVAHPGGRSYDTFPVNSYEAESRRLARFFRHGHQQGKFTPPPEIRTGDFPFTLDLRNV